MAFSCFIRMTCQSKSCHALQAVTCSMQAKQIAKPYGCFGKLHPCQVWMNSMASTTSTGNGGSRVEGEGVGKVKGREEEGEVYYTLVRCVCLRMR